MFFTPLGRKTFCWLPSWVETTVKPVEVVDTKKLGRTGVSEVVMVCEEVVSPLVADEAEHENWLRLVYTFVQFPSTSR